MPGMAVLPGGEGRLSHRNQAGAFTPLDAARAPAASALLIGELGALAPLDPFAVAAEAAGALTWGTGHASQTRPLAHSQPPRPLLFSLSLSPAPTPLGTCCGAPPPQVPPVHRNNEFLLFILAPNLI